jgi:hypothetical protein
MSTLELVNLVEFKDTPTTLEIELAQRLAVADDMAKSKSGKKAWGPFDGDDT